MSRQSFVQTLYLRYKPFHFLEVGSSFSIETNCHLSIFTLYLGDAFLFAFLLAVLFQFSELAGLSHAKKAFNVSVVPELWHCHEVIEEILQNSHALLYVSLRPLCCFLFGDGRDHLRGVLISEVIAKPLEIGVPAADLPLHLYCGNFKLQEGSGANSEKPSTAFPLRTE